MTTVTVDCQSWRGYSCELSPSLPSLKWFPHPPENPTSEFRQASRFYQPSISTPPELSISGLFITAFISLFLPPSLHLIFEFWKLLSHPQSTKDTAGDYCKPAKAEILINWFFCPIRFGPAPTKVLLGIQQWHGCKQLSKINQITSPRGWDKTFLDAFKYNHQASFISSNSKPVFHMIILNICI